MRCPPRRLRPVYSGVLVHLPALLTVISQSVPLQGVVKLVQPIKPRVHVYMEWCNTKA